MIEERFKVGKWKLIDIVFAEGICANCQKPITYLYFIEDEKGNKCTVGSECFKQIALKIPPKARQYIDLKERVLKNIELILKNNIQAIHYSRDGVASLAYPDVFVNNKWTGAVYLHITFNSGASREPRFDVEEETINELLKMGWKEYQEPRSGFGGIESNRFTILDTAKAQDLEKALITRGWKVYENPAKRYKLGYYQPQET